MCVHVLALCCAVLALASLADTAWFDRTTGLCRVRSTVSGEIVAPFADRPSEGSISFAADISPMAMATEEVTLPAFLALFRSCDSATQRM